MFVGVTKSRSKALGKASPSLSVQEQTDSASSPAKEKIIINGNIFLLMISYHFIDQYDFDNFEFFNATRFFLQK